MQIVINIDSYQLEHCKRHVKEHYANWLEETVANGTPLDKIRAEIAETPKKYPMTMDYENGLKEALGIIDKYKAETEEKE